ncbi:transcriptional attenuator, LytR family [Anaeromicropila populeti]|uniref:Transcriptional attenuator, LytR family n=2 Tax=Anaeromicropila populeti TaxID=37658 RepID=A0A1I6JY33_9FIRM|nr:transcriptional attenuator, LytR family [Anaeromicropila populeti]
MKEDDWLSEVNSDIAKQVRENMVRNENGDNLDKKEEKEVKVEDSTTGEVRFLVGPFGDSAQDIQEEELEEDNLSEAEKVSEGKDENLQEEDEPFEESKPPKKKMGKGIKILIGIFSFVLLLTAGAAVLANHMINRINYEDPTQVTQQPSDLSEEELALKPTPTPQVFQPEVEDEVINVLLIGEEAMNDTVGRSDSMMIATINTAQKSLKLTSLMRDIYVEIPGYANNKLNAAFHNGGGVLLTETVEQNFGVQIDGYIRVDYSNFENIIDKLGGVEIELTNNEAYYLNTTNYISDPANRYVKAGLQTLNGNQALGYCRVRYRTTSNGERDDFGRTYRQRAVLTAIFNKYKTKNVVEMVSIANDMLECFTTNLTKTEIIEYVKTVATLGTTELETLRIPLDDAYYGESYNCGSVLVMDQEKNIAALREFLYGEKVAATMEEDESSGQAQMQEVDEVSEEDETTDLYVAKRVDELSLRGSTE